MSVHPKTGRNIRLRGKLARSAEQTPGTGRHLTLLERLQIADLLGHGLSLRAVAVELGRSPSTISRGLHRHTDEAGRYQPHQAQQTAMRERQRPREPKLVADTGLRQLVQRKLNRYWSPEQIAGWLRAQHPDDPTRTVCTETIYQALVVPGAVCLHSRYTIKLRTGRALRRAHFLREGHVLQPLVLPPVRAVGIQPQDSCCPADRHLVLAQLHEPALHPAVAGGTAHAGQLGRLQGRGSAVERRPERGLDRGGTSQVMTAVASG